MFVMSKAEIERTRRLLGTDAEDVLAVREKNIGYASERGTLLAELASKLRFFARIEELLVYAGVSAAQKRKLQLSLLAAAFIAIAPSILFKFYFCLPLLPLALLLLWQWLKLQSFKRARSFESDYTALLLSVASAVRTGMDPLIALSQSAGLFAEGSGVRIEIEKLKTDLEVGLSEEAALRRFGQTIEHPDVRLFVTAFILARRQGSSLSECLQRLVRVTRQRQSFRRKVRSSVAMQRLSSFGIAGCTLVIAMIQVVTNPQSIQQTLSHPIGVKVLALGVGLILLGMAWMVRMTSSKI